MLNIKKTKIMDTEKCADKTAIVIDGEEIENVEHFEYLGARFQRDGSSKYEIRRRLAIAKQKLNNLENIWKGHNKQMKLQILKTCIFPIALYGCEAWTLLQSDIKKLMAFEMTCYRKLLRIPWTAKLTNTEVRKRLHVTTSQLLKQLKKQKLGYFGHIKRHNTMERTILEGKLEGKRNRGRPRTRWDKNIEDWMNESVASAGRLAQDRTAYRERVWAATSNGTHFPEDMPD